MKQSLFSLSLNKSFQLVSFFCKCIFREYLIIYGKCTYTRYLISCHTTIYAYQMVLIYSILPLVYFPIQDRIPWLILTLSTSYRVTYHLE